MMNCNKYMKVFGVGIVAMTLFLPLTSYATDSWDEVTGIDEKIDTELKCLLPNGKKSMNGVMPGSILPVKVTLTRKDNGQPMTKVKVNYGLRGVDGHERVATDNEGKAVANVLVEKMGTNVIYVSFYAGDSSKQGGSFISQCDLHVTVDDSIDQLNHYIRTYLGAEHLTTDIWQYYAERLTTSADAPDRIATVDKLRDVMKYWLLKQSDKPRGLTSAEHAARSKQQGKPWRSKLNATAREVFGSNPTVEQWKYWATRIDNDEISDIDDLRNKMTYHRNYFLVHKKYP